MQTTSKLLLATIAISQWTGKQVTAIQFEDGSGHNFNYQLEGGDWQFINLNQESLGTVFYHQFDLINDVKNFTILPTTYNKLLIK